ncbi:MAG: tail fiber domain-containing protein [Bacteroidales bacterium]|nr:tail fiber domain-containing protein [Bacteroidales bacterium]
MKKLLFLFVFSLVVKCMVAQDVTGFKYQAVVRDNSEELMVDKSVDIKISIIDLSGDGTTLYTESHTKVTNAYGLIDLIIGEGTAETGVFQDIVWDENKKFIKIELDSGSGLKNLGTVQLLSVPFSKFSNSALHADVATLANSASTLGGENVYSTTSDTLFVVKDNSGNVVFAVFPDGAQVYVDESVKGKVGGFAVSGRNPNKAEGVDIFRVTPDSTRIFVNPTTVKGKVGGFAVSGRNPNKAIGDDYLVITPDSTRIYVNQTAKGKVGGFAVSGRNPNKGATIQFLDLTPDNYFIGHQTGANLTTGLYNIMLGYESGLSNQSGSYNTFLGYQSGYLNNASYNSFLGYLAGRENTIGAFNTFMGYESGRSNDEGDYNVFLGHQTGYSNTDGHENVFIGYRSGYSNTAGYDNIFIGNLAGENASGNTHSTFIGNEAGQNVTGDDNIYIGDRAGTNAYVTNHESFGTVILGIDAGRNVVGQNNTVLGYGGGSSWGGESSGDNNTFVGAGAGMGGHLTRLGSDNVCLGNNAGSGKTGDNKLYIANNSSSTLIYGEFDNNQVVINGVATDNPLDYTFYVNGRGGGDYSWNSLSDERKKKNIQTIDGALDKVLKLRGVSFDWKDTEMKGRQIGFIAQEAKEVVPEVVLGSDETEYSMQYAPITAVLVEAVKEQQQQIESHKNKIDLLEKENKELTERLEKLEKLILK